MSYKEVYIELDEAEKLACEILGLDYEEIGDDTPAIDNALYDELNINLSEFREILSRLVPLIDVYTSPITKTRYKGFSNQQGVWILKNEVRS
ncbi:MAG: hypothetical protein ACK5JD_06220 [Mangrovibacterium sp.]